MSADSSELSSAPSGDDSEIELTKKDGILKFFSKVSKAPAKKAAPTIPASPPPPEREPSPPHEYVLADNPDIGFIVVFRSRFTEAFPKSLPNFGPQELERGVVDTIPGENAEHLLCALLGLLLNRKQDVKSGHYNRALEEAVSTHKSQWPKDWESKNPLLGGTTFSTMTPVQRLALLRTLIHWSLASSESIKAIITASYKQNRHEDDLNQPLSFQPWGSDSYRKKYYLVEGLDDTNFRVYKEGGGVAKRTWWSVAGDIEELKKLAEKLLTQDGGQKARLLSGKMLSAIPRFEATEEKRKRREYRQIRKQQFKRPEPNYSLYEGRTRGKRIKYTYSDEEDEGYSDSTNRRSTRNTGANTPVDQGPTITQSGRQVRSRQGGAYGETILSGAHESIVVAGQYEGVGEQSEEDVSNGRRPRRAAASGVGHTGGKHIEGYNSVDEMDDEDDASEVDYGDDEEDEDHVVESEEDEPEVLTDAEDDEMDLDLIPERKQSLVVKLPVKTPTPEKKASIKLVLSPQKRENYTSLSNGSAVTSNGLTALTINSTEDQAIPGAVSLPSVTDAKIGVSAKPVHFNGNQNASASPSPTEPAFKYGESAVKHQGLAVGISVGQNNL